LALTRGYPISAVPDATPQVPQGPLALPGRYSVRLTVDGERLQASLTLKSDPRVPLAAGALEDQFQLTTKLAALLSTSTQALLTAKSERAQLKALATTKETAEAVQRYDARLSALLDPPEHDDAQPHEALTQLTLSDAAAHINTLYTEITRADAAPTATQRSASVAADEALAHLLVTWRALQTDLPALNQRLRAAKVGPIRTDLQPPRDLSVADED
jgi:hypothetical protein